MKILTTLLLLGVSNLIHASSGIEKADYEKIKNCIEATPLERVKETREVYKREGWQSLQRALQKRITLTYYKPKPKEGAMEEPFDLRTILAERIRDAKHLLRGDDTVGNLFDKANAFETKCTFLFVHCNETFRKNAKETTTSQTDEGKMILELLAYTGQIFAKKTAIAIDKSVLEFEREFHERPLHAANFSSMSSLTNGVPYSHAYRTPFMSLTDEKRYNLPETIYQLQLYNVLYNLLDRGEDDVGAYLREFDKIASRLVLDAFGKNQDPVIFWEYASKSSLIPIAEKIQHLSRHEFLANEQYHDPLVQQILAEEIFLSGAFIKREEGKEEALRMLQLAWFQSMLDKQNVKAPVPASYEEIIRLTSAIKGDIKTAANDVPVYFLDRFDLSEGETVSHGHRVCSTFEEMSGINVGEEKRLNFDEKTIKESLDRIKDEIGNRKAVFSISLGFWEKSNLYQALNNLMDACPNLLISIATNNATDSNYPFSNFFEKMAKHKKRIIYVGNVSSSYHLSAHEIADPEENSDHLGFYNGKYYSPVLDLKLKSSPLDKKTQLHDQARDYWIVAPGEIKDRTTSRGLSDGTSFATPRVSAALMLALSKLDPLDAVQAVLLTGRKSIENSHYYFDFKDKVFKEGQAVEATNLDPSQYGQGILDLGVLSEYLKNPGDYTDFKIKKATFFPDAPSFGVHAINTERSSALSKAIYAKERYDAKKLEENKSTVERVAFIKKDNQDRKEAASRERRKQKEALLKEREAAQKEQSIEFEKSKEKNAELATEFSNLFTQWEDTKDFETVSGYLCSGDFSSKGSFFPSSEMLDSLQEMHSNYKKNKETSEKNVYSEVNQTISDEDLYNILKKDSFLGEDDFFKNYDEYNSDFSKESFSRLIKEKGKFASLQSFQKIRESKHLSKDAFQTKKEDYFSDNKTFIKLFKTKERGEPKKDRPDCGVHRLFLDRIGKMHYEKSFSKKNALTPKVANLKILYHLNQSISPELIEDAITHSHPELFQIFVANIKSWDQRYNGHHDCDDQLNYIKSLFETQKHD